MVPREPGNAATYQPTPQAQPGTAPFVGRKGNPTKEAPLSYHEIFVNYCKFLKKIHRRQKK